MQARPAAPDPSSVHGERVYRRVRRAAEALSSTPLHPQWFSFRGKAHAYDRVSREAAGDLLDVGSGDGRLRLRTRGCRYVGLDHPTTGGGWYGARPDVFADAARLPFLDASFDAVALLDVLEHLPDPWACLRETGRVLREGGRLYLNVPCLYPLHDEPHDYQRPTEHGLHRWLQDAGYEVVEIRAIGSPPETAALLSNIAIAGLMVRAVRIFPPAILFGLLLAPFVLAINLCGWLLGRLAASDHGMPFAYWCVARRPAAGSGRLP